MYQEEASTPISNVIGRNIIMYARWHAEYTACCLSYKKCVEWHKERLGRQIRCTQGHRRYWVWEGENWRVFVSNRRGLLFEVRLGMTPEEAMVAWHDYMTQVGLDRSIGITMERLREEHL